MSRPARKPGKARVVRSTAHVDGVPPVPSLPQDDKDVESPDRNALVFRINGSPPISFTLFSSRYQLSPGEIRLYLLLAKRGALDHPVAYHSGALAKRLAMSPDTITRLVKKLQRKGLATRLTVEYEPMIQLQPPAGATYEQLDTE